jgi:TatD DNase family protein
MIDCHAHFYPPNFTDTTVIASELEYIISVPETLENCQSVLDISLKNPKIRPCAGLHPVQPIGENFRFVQLADWTAFEPWLQENHTHLIGLGECGLDYSPHFPGWTSDTKDIQLAVFKNHLQASKTYHLPVNVHSRSAGHYAIDAMIESQVGQGLLHAFDGHVKYALKGAQNGFYFSVPPSVVRSPSLEKLVKALPMANLVLESDAPALGPVKGEPNHPDNIRIACEAIARIKGVAMEHVISLTRENTLKLFPKLLSAAQV